jgi:hypothetical protein
MRTRKKIVETDVKGVLRLSGDGTGVAGGDMVFAVTMVAVVLAVAVVTVAAP